MLVAAAPELAHDRSSSTAPLFRTGSPATSGRSTPVGITSKAVRIGCAPLRPPDRPPPPSRRRRWPSLGNPSARLSPHRQAQPQDRKPLDPGPPRLQGRAPRRESHPRDADPHRHRSTGLSTVVDRSSAGAGAPVAGPTGRPDQVAGGCAHAGKDSAPVIDAPARGQDSCDCAIRIPAPCSPFPVHCSLRRWHTLRICRVRQLAQSGRTPCALISRRTNM